MQKFKFRALPTNTEVDEAMILALSSLLLVGTILLALSTTEHGDCINGHVNNASACLLKIVGVK